jgi:hypothetical protein
MRTPCAPCRSAPAAAACACERGLGDDKYVLTVGAAGAAVAARRQKRERFFVGQRAPCSVLSLQHTRKQDIGSELVGGPLISSLILRRGSPRRSCACHAAADSQRAPRPLITALDQHSARASLSQHAPCAALTSARLRFDDDPLPLRASRAFVSEIAASAARAISTRRHGPWREPLV